MRHKSNESKLGSTALAIGATSVASLMAIGAAKATECVPNPIMAPGGDSITTPTSVIDSHCTFTGIDSFFQGLPAYWEFAWDQVPNPVNISSTGSFVSGDAPTLALYDETNGDSLVASATYNPDVVGSFGFYNGTLGDLTLAPDDYIIGILPATGEDQTGSFAINFASVPEPGALGLFGGALAGLFAFVRRKSRKQSA